MVAGNRVSCPAWASMMKKNLRLFPFRMPLGYTLQGYGLVCGKRYRSIDSTPGNQPGRCEPIESAARCGNLVEIETDGTESAERIAGQRAGECGVGIVGFIGEVSYVDRNLHSFYPVRDGRIVNHV